MDELARRCDLVPRSSETRVHPGCFSRSLFLGEPGTGLDALIGLAPCLVVTISLSMSTIDARSPQVAFAALRLGHVPLFSIGLAVPAAKSWAFNDCVSWADVTLSLAAECLRANWFSSLVATRFGACSNAPL